MKIDKRYIDATISMAFWLTTILGLIILVGLMSRHCTHSPKYEGEIVTDTATLVTLEDSVAYFEDGILLTNKNTKQ